MSDLTPIPAEQRAVYYDALRAGRAEAERLGYGQLDDRIFLAFDQAQRGPLAELVLAAARRKTEREHGERIAQALEVAAGHRCPTCRGKAGSTTYKGGWGNDPTSRCGAGHTWSGPRAMDVYEVAAIARTTGIGDQP